MATAQNSDLTKDNSKSESNHLLVCAIDFGTTFTGVAYSFSTDYTDITVKTKHSNRSYGEKVPTCVLLKEDKSFYKFGYEAEDKYKQLCENENAEDYFFFENFKMKLYETKNITTDVRITDVHNRPFPALDIFTMVIKHLVNEIENMCKLRCACLQQDDIMWVLTVPAIWSDSAKSFMRKAAEKAGIESQHLMLCLEPEAASLWCNNLKVCKSASYDGKVDVKSFPEGQKYIVADLGGGTADIAVHEILPDRNLKEIRRADGGAFGGNLIDESFFQLLNEIYGVNVMTHIREKEYNEIMELKVLFQIKCKNSFNPTLSDPKETVNIRVPVAALSAAIKEVEEESSLKDKMQKAQIKFKDKLSFPNTKFSLVLNSIAIEGFFDDAVNGIVKYINDMRKDDELNEINIIMLVGGLSSSPYIQSAIKQRVPGLRIFVPDDPSLAVLKGAVFMGHKPRAITEKIARYTYGLSVARTFRPGVDPEKLLTIQDGQILCSSVFAKMVEKGTVYKPGDEFGEVIVRHVPLGVQGLLGTLQTSVFRSDDTDPTYADEEYGCEIGATINMPAPRNGWPVINLFIPKMVLGLSEMTVKVYNSKDETKDEVLEAKLEFL